MFPRRTPPNTLRRVAMTAALAALLAPVGSAEAAKKKKPKAPVITSVAPLSVEVGDTLTIRGRNFRPGRGKNTVVFKRDGARAVFVKADLATKRLIKVKVPQRLVDFMANQGTVKVATRFRIRILANRFGKAFTPDSRSPMIAPDSPPPPPPPPAEAKAGGDCDGDGVLNKDETDDDNDGLTDDVELSLPNLDPCKVDTDADGLEDRWEYDCDRNGTLNRDQPDDDSDLLEDALENTIGTDGCVKDTDTDGIEDGYEYQSAIDLNDDNFQNPNQSLPYPGKRPYPNPLAIDSKVDYDGDGLWLVDEYSLWSKIGPRALGDMVYSDGQQRSRNIATVGYDKAAAFLATAAAQGYNPNVLLDFDSAVIPGYSGLGEDYDSWASFEWVDGNKPAGTFAGGYVATKDTNYAPDGLITDVEKYYYDLDYNGVISDDERDEDADGLGNWVEAHGPMNADWWGIYAKENTYVNEFEGTDLADADTDGDGVIDGMDDNDFDDMPNVRESRRQLSAGEFPHGAPDPRYVAEPTTLDADGNWVAPADPPAYERFVMGDNPDDILWNRPRESAPNGLPVDDGPWRAWVQPFNPCLPDPRSRTCERHPNLSALYPPFAADTPVFNVYDGHDVFAESGETWGLDSDGE